MESRIRFYLDSTDNVNNFFNANSLKILLLGYGKSSKALIKYFTNKDVDIDILRPENKKEYNKFIKELPQYDICFRSPGIAINKPVYSLCNLLAKEFSNELVYAIKKCECKNTILVTGSNGKTSLCKLLFEVLNIYKKSHLYGNIGDTLIDKIDRINKDDFLILEISSFQLENLSTNIDVGIIKNLHPNHLNSTFNKATYFASKKRLKLYSSYFIDKDNSSSYIAIKDDKIYAFDKEYLDINELNIKETSFIENILIVLNVLIYYKLDINLAKNVIKNFKQVKYRNNVIKYKNTIFVNDGKSTSSAASKYCFNQYKGNRILILGGIHKSNKFNLTLNEKDEIYIYGKDKERIFNEIKKGKLFISLDEVLKSIKNIENKVIIFSPGCSSFDQYKNYIERSEVFDKWVKSWIK